MESDRSLQQKVAVGGGGGGRSKLSLRRKKDKDPPTQQHPSPPPNPTNLSLRITPCDILTIITPKASKTTSTTHSGESGRDLDTSTHNKTAPVKKLKPGGTSDDVECVPLDAEREEMGKDERTEMELQHVPSPHTSTHDKTAPMKKLKPGGTDDDVEYVSLDEEREEMGIDERTRMELQHVSSPHPDRLVQLMRESKKTSPAVMDSVASSGVQESSSSSRTVGEGEGERGEPLQTRRSKRLVDQSGKGGKQGKGLEATSILSREDEDFAMPPSDERTKMELQQVSSPHPADIDDDDEGLGDFYFCHICQKDLTRFSESRRQTHINRCCDKQEEEKESVAAAAAKEGQSSAFACLLCKKSFKSDNVRVMVIKVCAAYN